VKPESHRITFVEKNDPVVSFGVIHTDKHKWITTNISHMITGVYRDLSVERFRTMPERERERDGWNQTCKAVSSLILSSWPYLVPLKRLNCPYHGYWRNFQLSSHFLFTKLVWIVSQRRIKILKYSMTRRFTESADVHHHSHIGIWILLRITCTL
jgi:hypothetical protein